MGNLINNLINFFAFTRPKYNQVAMDCEKNGGREICEYVTKVNDHFLNMYTISKSGIISNFDIDYVILYSGGNEESVSDTYKRRIEILNFFDKITNGCNIVVVTYNYPISGYAPGEAQFHFRFIERMTDFLTQKPILKVVHKAIEEVFEKISIDYWNENTKFVLWGRSIGSLPTGHLLHTKCKVDKSRICFSIIESGLSSIVQARFPHIKLELLLRDGNLDYAKQDKDWGKVIFIYGSLDNVVHPINTQLVYQALNPYNTMIIKVEGKGHNMNLVEFGHTLGELITEYCIADKKLQTNSIGVV